MSVEIFGVGEAADQITGEVAVIVVDDEGPGMGNLHAYAVAEEDDDHRGEEIDHIEHLRSDQIPELLEHIGPNDTETHPFSL
jgi:hypothetical protein